MQASLLRTIRTLRKDDSFCDVEFLVGEEKVAMKANSTILALRSTHFKVISSIRILR